MKISNTFLNGYFKQKTAETGRSMVEILGVLAIIGVLSIGGIYGYSFAMDKYRANDIIYEVNLRNRDTWNKYQDKDLPEAEELDEWAEVTQTGFPIGVYPRSNIVFDVQVDDVPSRVCKQVLNMNIEGPMFIWTPSEDGKKQIFNGNASELCGDDIETSIVFTTSLDSYGQDEGLRQGATDENGRPIRYCTEDSDCMEKCETCGLSYTCESNCPSDKPICSTNEYKTCVVCEKNSDCPKNQICDESTEENQCVEVPKTCPEGTFRSKNGACIKCKYGGNIIVSEDAFNAFGIQDVQTGIEMCQACGETGNVRIWENVTHEDGSKTYYCSATCTKGISVQTREHGCIACSDYPLYEDYVIPSDTQAKSQCEACGLTVQVAYGGTSRCGHFDCPAGQVKNYQGKCSPCDGQLNSIILLELEKAESMCTQNCSEQRVLNSGNSRDCMRICPQPSDMSDEESTRICQEEGPTSSNCKRMFIGNHNWNYSSCYSCNVATSYSLSNVPEEYHDLCEKCGRQEKNGYCVIPIVCKNEKNEDGTNKATNQFLNMKSECRSCTETDEGASRIEQTAEAHAACVNNCAGVSGTSNGVKFTGRHVIKTNQGFDYCFPKCPEGYFQSADGQCVPCTTDDGNTSVRIEDWGMTDLKSICEHEKCGRTVIQNSYCAKKTCSTGEFMTAYGNCVSCQTAPVSVKIIRYASEAGYSLITAEEKEALQKMCTDCGNRMIVHQDGTSQYCVIKNPGVSGVCNNEDNGDDVGYPGGQGVWVRDSTGMCYDCLTATDIYVGSAGTNQCKSCGNRRFTSLKNCVLGACEQGTTFMNIKGICTTCDSSTTEIDNVVTSTDGCISCNRQVMTIKASETESEQYYCAIPCSEGITYHSSGDKNCKSCSSGSITIIGTEPIYSGYCESCNRVAFEENGIKKCSQQATDGYFINISGNKVSCSAGKTQIYNSAKAKEICRSCTLSEREVTTDLDGNFYCEKVL